MHHGKTRAPAAIGTLALVCAAGLPGSGAAAQQPDRVDGARAALEKWVETEQIISRERRDWALGREMLLERIELVRRETDSLRAAIAEAERGIAEADSKRAELIAENEALAQGSAVFGDTAAQLEAGTLALVRRLPDPLRERVKPLTQQFPDDPADTRLSLSQRYQNVVGTLNAVNKFNRDVSVWSEVRPLADGGATEVTTLYLGIGQGYYVNARGDLAGIGTAAQDAWVWEAADDAAPDIARAVAIHSGAETPAYVRLPFRVR